MKFLADENMRRRVVTWLRLQKHDVISVSDDYARHSDEDLLTIAAAEQRLILTNDTDFGRLIFSDHKHHAGVVLFRLKHNSKERYIEALQEIIAEGIDLSSAFVTVMDQKIRIKRI